VRLTDSLTVREITGLQISFQAGLRRCFVNSTYLLIGFVLVLVIVGASFGPNLVRRIRSDRLKVHDEGSEYQFALQTMGNERRAQRELDEQQKHISSADIRPLTVVEQEHYQAEWTAVQSGFTAAPGQAIIDADHLGMEVMQLRGYPVANFEQQAADISTIYPDLVMYYRAARDIAIKNKQNQANPEELNQAMISYGSLFDELLGGKAVVEGGK
jgi:hypothetical protein